MKTNALTTIETDTEILVNSLLSHSQLIEFGKKQIKLLKKAKVGKYLTFNNGLTISKSKTTRDDLKVRTELVFFKNGKKIGMYVLRDFHRV